MKVNMQRAGLGDEDSGREEDAPVLEDNDNDGESCELDFDKGTAA